MKTRIAVLGLAAFTLAACQMPDPPRQPVEPGMSRAEVVDRIGKPCREARRTVGGTPQTELGFYCVRGIPKLAVWLEDDTVVRSQRFD